MTLRRCVALLACVAVLSACGTAAASPATPAPRPNEQFNQIVAGARSELELAVSWAPGFLDVGQEMRRFTDGFNKQYGLSRRPSITSHWQRA